MAFTATRRVFFLRAPDVVAQHAAAGVHGVLHARELALAGALVARHLLGRGVVHVGAEGRDLDHLVLAAPAVHHVHDAKAPPDDEGAAKQRLDLLGRGVGGHVEVLGAQAQQQVAHRAAHHVGLVARLLQRRDHVFRAFVDQGRIDLVHFGRHLLALAEAALALRAVGGLAEQLVDEFLDHLLVGSSCSLFWFALIRSRAWSGSAEW
jgi:hypothetical protein